MTYVQSNPATGQQSLDPVDMACAFDVQREELSMKLTLVFVLDRRRSHDSAGVLFSLLVADEDGEQLTDIQPVAFGAAATAVYFDAAGIEDLIVDPLGQQEAMEREAIATGFVAAYDRRLRRETEALFGPRPISASSEAVSRAAITRRRGGVTMPMLMPRFHLLQPSSSATYNRRAAVLQFTFVIAVMGVLLAESGLVTNFPHALPAAITFT